MKTFAVLALVGAALAAPSAVTSAIAPAGTIPAGCSETYSGEFEISIVNASTISKRALEARTALTITLKDGVLTDAEGRTGYIASNDQFQFDKPAQDGAIYTAGWSVCSNGTLALGSSAIFYECLSGTFYNLYDESQGAQCTAIFIDIVPVSSGSTTTSAASAAVSQISDGQIQATTSTAAVVSQISDGQIQATTATSAVVVSQISDGQIQATTATSAVVVSQISDGQIQATTATSAAVTTAAVVSQISDGQIQATASAASSTGAVVSQISDGQIQAATNGTSATIASATLSASASVYTGAAALPTMKTELFGLAAGVMALAML